MKKLILAAVATATLAGAAQAEYIYTSSEAGYVGYVNIHDDQWGSRDLPIVSKLGIKQTYPPMRVKPGTVVEYKDTMGNHYSYAIPKGYDLNINFKGTVFVSQIEAWITLTKDPLA